MASRILEVDGKKKPLGVSAGEMKVAIVGATGAVGEQLIELVEERGLAYAELGLFASEAGDDEEQDENHRAHEIKRFQSPDDLKPFDVAFLAVPAAVADTIIDYGPGPVLIDLSGAARSPATAPIVAPGVTPREQVATLPAHKRIETPHPAAYCIANAIKVLCEGPETISATVLLSSSERGRNEVTGLIQQSFELLSAQSTSGEDDEPRRAFNLYSAKSGEVEQAISAQVSTLLGRRPNLMLRTVRVPIAHGCAVSIFITGLQGKEESTRRLREAPGLLLLEGDQAIGIADAVGQEAILVSCDRFAGGLSLWCVFDNARVGASNALWVAENLGLGGHMYAS